MLTHQVKNKIKKIIWRVSTKQNKKKSQGVKYYLHPGFKKNCFLYHCIFLSFFFCVCMYVIALEGWGIKIFIPTPPLVLSNWKKKMFSHYSFMYSHKMVGWMWVVGHLTPKYTLQNCLSLLWVWNSIFSSFFIVHFIVILHVLVFENFFCIQTSIFILTFLHAQ